MFMSKKSLTQSPIWAAILAPMLMPILALCLLISGCAITPSVVAPPPSPHVFVDSAIPKSSVADLRVNEGTGVSGLLEVEATFQNKRSGPYHFVYRFIWFDNNNFTIKSRLSNWKSLEVQKGVFATLSGIAPSDRVVGYRLEIYSQDTIFQTKTPVNAGNK